MRKIIITSNISLDGVIQAPMGADEDMSGGFRYGGWTSANGDALSGKTVQKEMNQKTDYLLGRKTFELFASFWPANGKMWPAIIDGTKYVLSKTLKSSAWENTVFLDSLEKIKELRNSDGPDIQVWGSSELTQLLLQNALADELHLRIFPVILGNGKKLFDDNALATSFTLDEYVVSKKGVFMATYRRTGEMTPSQGADNLVRNYFNG